MNRTVRLALAIFVLSANAARAIEKEAPAEQLRILDDRKKRTEAVLHELDNKKFAVLMVLERIEKERRAAEEEAKAAHSRESMAVRLLDIAREKEDQVRQRRVGIAHDLKGRLLLRYELRGTSYLQMLLSAPSIGDVLWRRRMVDRVLRNDFTLIHQWALVQNEETKAREAVEKQRQDSVAAEQAAKDREADAADRREVQDDVLKGLAKQKAGWARMLAEVEASRDALMKLMGAMPTGSGPGGFARMRGQLPWPVKGVIEARFGKMIDPRFHTVLQQKGFDLRAVEGTPVLAPFGAVVGYAGWFSGFGNLVILDHGEGYYTLYAHLKETDVTKGDHIEAGATLGEVGDTASLKGAYLYFELRSGSKPLDPGQWLKKK